jgi:serine/threonine-protein kinase TTK/MPS1
MVYGQAPFAHITNLFQKIQAIPNPQCAIPFQLPLKIRHRELLSESTVQDMIKVISGCLDRDPKKRFTVEELLCHRFMYS